MNKHSGSYLKVKRTCKIEKCVKFKKHEYFNLYKILEQTVLYYRSKGKVVWLRAGRAQRGQGMRVSSSNAHKVHLGGAQVAQTCAFSRADQTVTGKSELYCVYLKC